MYFSTENLINHLLNEEDQTIENPFKSNTSSSSDDSPTSPSQSSNDTETSSTSDSTDSQDTSSSSSDASNEDSSDDSSSSQDSSPNHTVDDPFLGDHPDGAPIENDANGDSIKSKKTIEIGGKTQEDSSSLREYFFNNFNEFYSQYESIESLIKTLSKKTSGTSSAEIVLEQLSQKIELNKKMIDSFFKEELIVTGEIDVIFKIYKSHQSDTRLITRILKDVSRSIFNTDNNKNKRKKS